MKKAQVTPNHPAMDKLASHMATHIVATKKALANKLGQLAARLSQRQQKVSLYMACIMITGWLIWCALVPATKITVYSNQSVASHIGSPSESWRSIPKPHDTLTIKK